MDENLNSIIYVLNLDDSNRILSACFDNSYIDPNLPRVNSLPDGDLYDYLYINNDFVYDPIIKEGE